MIYQKTLTLERTECMTMSLYELHWEIVEEKSKLLNAWQNFDWQLSLHEHSEVIDMLLYDAHNELVFAADMKGMGVWQGVAMDLLQFHPGSPCLAILCSAGGSPLKQAYGCFRGGTPTGLSTCGQLLPFWTPLVVRL
jgi:hypothetical protein